MLGAVLKHSYLEVMVVSYCWNSFLFTFIVVMMTSVVASAYSTAGHVRMDSYLL